MLFPTCITLHLSALSFICHCFAQLLSLDSVFLTSICIDVGNQYSFVYSANFSNSLFSPFSRMLINILEDTTLVLIADTLLLTLFYAESWSFILSFPLSELTFNPWLTALYLLPSGWQVSLIVSCVGLHQKPFESLNKLHPLVFLYPLFCCP